MPTIELIKSDWLGSEDDQGGRRKAILSVAFLNVADIIKALEIMENTPRFKGKIWLVGSLEHEKPIE